MIYIKILIEKIQKNFIITCIKGKILKMEKIFMSIMKMLKNIKTSEGKKNY